VEKVARDIKKYIASRGRFRKSIALQAVLLRENQSEKSSCRTGHLLQPLRLRAIE